MCSIWSLVSPKSKIFYCIYLNVNYVGGAMGYGRQQKTIIQTVIKFITNVNFTNVFYMVSSITKK